MSSIEAIVDSAHEIVAPNGRSMGIAGWAFSKRGQVLAVQVWFGDILLGHLPYGFPRPDVQQHFGTACRTGHVGFEGSVRLPVMAVTGPSLDLRLVIVTDYLEKKDLPVSQPGQPSPEHGQSSPATTQRGETISKPLACPNFFILGAGKCGTTSLYHVLRQHREIHMPDLKEPSFFSSGFQVIKNPIEYFNLFPKQEGRSRYGEASHVYFSAPEAAPVLHQLFPAAKFILIFRNPVNRAYSLYRHMRRIEMEPLESFEQALATEELRYSDPVFQRDCPQYFWNYMYYRSSRYDEQLGHYLNFFPISQFFCLTLGEWKSSPAHWAKRIFEFLGVDPAVEMDFEPQNQSGGYVPLLENTRQELTRRFEGLRERLQGMIGRQLLHWDD
jgi:hypothetical protein